MITARNKGVFASGAKTPFSCFKEVMLVDSLIRNAETINRLLARYGVKFGIYKNGEFKEQLFPFDPIPRCFRAYEMTANSSGCEA